MANTGIQQKRRRYVNKQEQNTSGVYGGKGNNGANKGTSQARGRSPLNRVNTLDKLQSERKERRGRKSTGTTHYKSTSTGQKSRSRNANRRNRAKRGGK